jgi:hypothetical protein
VRHEIIVPRSSNAPGCADEAVAGSKVRGSFIIGAF